MVFHDDRFEARQRRASGLNLSHDVHTVAVLINHFSHRSNLPLNASETSIGRTFGFASQNWHLFCGYIPLGGIIIGKIYPYGVCSQGINILPAITLKPRHVVLT